MDIKTLSDAYEYFISCSDSVLVKLLFILCLSILFWRLCAKKIYILLTCQSGIHYINQERQFLHMVKSYNPFSFEADYTTANYSGIKCIFKSHRECYVQAFWGVPIYSLFQLLHGEWKAMKNAIKTHIPGEKFSSKCICANDLFLLSAGEEKVVEFKPRWHADESTLSQEAPCMREIYPFVVLMVLKKCEDIHDSFVVAMASAIHIPDKNLLLYSQLLGQYIKLSSGHVGSIKKIFLSSPETSEDSKEKYDLCLACYHRPVSMVFLPCRHACLCRVCFDLCDRCPVCRAASLYCFEFSDTHRSDNPES